MIIYKDILSGDEIISDTYKIIDAGNGMWEIDGQMITPGSENFVLAGANPSAEGDDAEEGDAAAQEKVLDIANNFRLQKIDGVSKKAYQAELKSYMKAVNTKLKEKGKSDEEIKKFQTNAQAAAKKILGNWDNYDVYKGESMEDPSMYILVDFREDGMTPYATIWADGLEEMKV